MDEELRFYTSTCNLLQGVYLCIYTIIIKLYMFRPYLCVYISTRAYCINIDALKMTSYSESGTQCGSHGIIVLFMWTAEGVLFHQLHAIIGSNWQFVNPNTTSTPFTYHTHLSCDIHAQGQV